MEKESVFRARYDEGMKKDEYWEAALRGRARHPAPSCPEIGAWHLPHALRQGRAASPPKPKLDWGANFAQHDWACPDPNGEFAKLMRLYFTLHCDHEGGNVSAFTCHTVGSALSDLYYSLSAGLNGLAGPLHGLANQECLALGPRDQQEVQRRRRPRSSWPSTRRRRSTPASVVPGYGHAVLRVTDPRFDAFHAFGAKHCPEDPAYQTMARVFKVVPEVLKSRCRRSRIRGPTSTPPRARCSTTTA